jgi:dihydrodipicolinate synthase/N-acetylneuraminate lyase
MLKRAKEKEALVIGGIHVAAITPRRAHEVEVDLGAMLELVDFLSGHQVQGITLFGTTGEFLHFTIEERSRYVALLAKRSRVPVMANVSHSTLDGAVMMAEEAAGAGIAGVLLMPPYYFHYPAATVEAFCLEFATQVSKWVKIYLYNIPEFTNEIPLEVMERLFATGMFAGIKDSCGDRRMMDGLLRLRASQAVTVLAGNDRIFAYSRQAGADGAISGVACAVPELMVALDRAIQSGDAGLAARLDSRVQEFIDSIVELPAPIGVKTAVGLRGIKSGPHSTLLGADLTAKLDRFQGWFRAWLPAVQGECKDAVKLKP